MSEEINFNERYDELLNIQPCYGIDRVKKKVKYDHVGLEIEVSVNYERERYTFIRTLLKKIKELVGEDGYFTKDGTIIGNYSFEIVLDPLPLNRISKIYSTLMQIIKFSDGSIIIDREHNCGIHMNFNQYDVKDLNEAHKRLLLFMDSKPNYFDENVYKQLVNTFDFPKYLEFQKNVGSKYVAVNYLNKKIVEVRNIKVGLKTKSMEHLINGVLDALYYHKSKTHKSEKTTQKMVDIMSEVFEDNNYQIIEESLEKNILIVKFDKKKTRVIAPSKKMIELIEKEVIIHE